MSHARPGESYERRAKARIIFVYVLVAILGAAAKAFAVQNPDPVTVSFLNSRTVSLPLSLLLMLSVFVGVVFASVSGFARGIELKLKIRQRNLSRRMRQSVAECSVGAPPRSLGRRGSAPSVSGTGPSDGSTRAEAQ